MGTTAIRVLASVRGAFLCTTSQSSPAGLLETINFYKATSSR